MVASFACFGPSHAHARPRLAALAALLAAFVLAAAPTHAQRQFTDGQAAASVLGQPDFTSATAVTTASGMTTPVGVAVDPTSGKLFVAELGNNRVLRFASASAFVNGEAADGVLGQADFTSSTAATTASGMRRPRGVAVDGAGRLFVADAGNNRVVRFDGAASKADGAAADGVLGQPDFISGTAATTASGMYSPLGVAVDGAGRLFVVEINNRRVVRFDGAASKANGAAADGVLGQADFTTNTAATTASGMAQPLGVAVDGAGRLFVADDANHRVVRFDGAASKANGAAADGVLGQPDFISGTAATTASGMSAPFGLAVDGAGRLFVADINNRRVLRFDGAASKANGAAADGVLGQPDFTTITAATTASGMRGPFGVAVDGAGRLFVADHYNHRVLRFVAPLPLASQTYPSTDVPVSIVDLTRATSTLTVPDNFTIGDVDVSVELTHTWFSDLEVSLTSPTGTFVELFIDVCGDAENGTFELDDEAAALMGSTCPPFGTFQPSTDLLAAFDGESAAGVWTLSIFDDAFADTGALLNWSLTFVPQQSPAASVTLDGAEGWRMLASPEGTTVGAFLADLWTQGFTGADDPAGECTVFAFSEGAASFSAGWTCVTDATDALARGEGLMVFVYEDDDNDGTVTAAEAFPKTLSASAAIAPTGDFAFSVALTDDGRPLAQKGWNLLGAPYGTSLDWDGIVRTGVTPTVYVYDPAFGPSGGYRTYTSEGGTGSGDLPWGLVPPFQGFFVKAYTSSPALSLPEDGGTGYGQDILGRTAPTDPPLPPVAPVQSASVATDALGAPEGTTALGAIAPNPTSGAATVAWSLAEAGAARVSVVDLLGREVTVLAEGSFAAGPHRSEVAGGRLAPGVYVVRLAAGTVTDAARFTVVR